MIELILRPHPTKITPILWTRHDQILWTRQFFFLSQIIKRCSITKIIKIKKYECCSRYLMLRVQRHRFRISSSQNVANFFFIPKHCNFFLNSKSLPLIGQLRPAEWKNKWTKQIHFITLVPYNGEVVLIFCLQWIFHQSSVDPIKRLIKHNEKQTSKVSVTKNHWSNIKFVI